MSHVLPLPDPAALALSEALANRVRAEIDAAGGWISFAHYMKLALYTPGLGYYSAGQTKLGAAGDFVTAPELGSAFAAVLARQCISLFAHSGLPPRIVEFGAGSGRLAADLLAAADAAGVGVEYCIVETSADFAKRQRDRLADYGERVRWLTGFPPAAELDGIVLANEVLDAFPVERFTKRHGGVLALGVAHSDGRLTYAERPATAALSADIEALERSLGAPLPDEYRSEICTVLPAWVASLAAGLRRGYVLVIDYGLVRRDYYHPSRGGGHLVCHYRHRAHDDPFLWPGLQDLSAWVDFSACAEAASAAGFEIAGFTTQAQFLLHGGLEWRPPDGSRGAAEHARELATLLLPGEMGERFKLLLLARGIETPAGLPGRDMRERL